MGGAPVRAPVRPKPCSSSRQVAPDCCRIRAPVEVQMERNWKGRRKRLGDAPELEEKADITSQERSRVLWLGVRPQHCTANICLQKNWNLIREARADVDGG